MLDLLGSESFLGALTTTTQSIAKMAIVAAIGFILVRRKALREEGLHAVVRLVIDFLVPAGLFLSLLRGFSLETLSQGSVLILLTVGWALGGVALATAAFRTLPGGDWEKDRPVVALASFQNSFYMPFPLIQSILSPQDFQAAAVYLGIAVLAVNPIQWSLGTFLIRGRDGKPPDWRTSVKQAINMPILGVVFGALCSFIPGLPEAARGEPGSWAILRVPLGSLDLLGQAMGTMALIAMGGLIGSTSVRSGLQFRPTAVACTIRLVLAPLAAWLVIHSGVVYVSPILGVVILVQASSPPAMNLALAARRFGGDWAHISATQLGIYAASAFTMPFWVALELARLGGR